MKQEHSPLRVSAGFSDIGIRSPHEALWALNR